MGAGDIVRLVAESRGLTVRQLRGPARHRAIARPRQEAMWLLREIGGLSYPQIGAELGGRDHSTTIHGVRKIGGLINDRPAYQGELRAVVGMAHAVTLPEGAGL